jgi:hypothetical protein
LILSSYAMHISKEKRANKHIYYFDADHE